MSDEKKEAVDRPVYNFNIHDYDIDPGLKDDDGVELPRPYTKCQMRKWLKRIKWENRKSEKRSREKARAKERRSQARADNIDLGPSRKSLKKRKLEQNQSNIGIIIDLSFDHLMLEKSRFKVIKQILRSYSINRRSLTPLKFIVTSFGGRTKSEMARHNGYENWDVKFEETSYLDMYPKEKLLYLTAESDNTIERFEEDNYYIIGGLVDHNEYKGMCYKIACEQGIRHARLPLEKYINMRTRKVLTIDHVFEIVLKVCEGVPWPDALIQVLPMRKGAHLSDNISSVDTESTHSDNDNESTAGSENLSSAIELN